MPKMRSFKNLNGRRGKKRTDLDGGSGYNSLGGRTSRPVNINRDQSSGMQRPNSPRASKQ